MLKMIKITARKNESRKETITSLMSIGYDITTKKLCDKEIYYSYNKDLNAIEKIQRKPYGHPDHKALDVFTVLETYPLEGFCKVKGRIEKVTLFSMVKKVFKGIHLNARIYIHPSDR